MKRLSARCLNLLAWLFFGLAVCSCSTYTKPQKIDEYLYTVEFSKYDFESLSRFVDGLFCGKKKLPGGAACSALRKDSLMGRNFDWYYDRMPEFVIMTTHAEDRYASIGIASPISTLKDNQVKGLWGAFILDKLPLFTVDGINERGVVCCVNVAPQGDCGYTRGTNPGKDKLYSALLVRYILDNAGSVEEAVRLVQERNIYTTVAFGLREDYHFMVADSVSTVVIEFVDNRPVVLKDSCIMTNFNLAGGATPHAIGLERYDILSDGYPALNGEDDMFCLLKKVWFSRMYRDDTDPAWLSELCSGNDVYGLTVDDIVASPDKVADALQKEKDKYRKRSRKTSGTWHTVHTSVYNIDSKSLSVSTQEGSAQHRFTLGGKKD